MEKKKQIIGLNMFVIISLIAYVFVMISANVSVEKVSVATISGSYGEQYAIDNMLNQVSLSDSEQIYFDQRYELFDYNVNGGNITIEKYEGKSSDLVIPELIEGISVTTIGEGFISSLDTVKNIYLPRSVTEILGAVDKSITIYCVEGSTLSVNYAETDWNIETVYDSDFINFNLGNLPFQYNQKETFVEITRYDGNDDLIVIPSYINGYPVATVSMDFVGKANVVVIPETVSNITGTSNLVQYSSVFMIELVFTVLAFVVSLITINILLPRFRKNLDEYMLTGNQIVAVVLYVVAQTVFGIVATFYLKQSIFVSLATSLIIIAMCVVIFMLGGTGRSHVKEVNEHVVEKTSRMKSIKNLSKDLANDIKNPELRKVVQRLVDEIRFSDSVSRADLDDIESDIEKSILNLKNSIAIGNESEVENLTDNITKMINERNIRCKSGK